MFHKELCENPLKNYGDLKKALMDIIKPYTKHTSSGSARIDLGPPAATFSNNAVYLEGFARRLWGIIPYIAGGNEYHDIDGIINGITNGVNPDHPEFWGWPGNYDQLFVEMGILGYALCLIPEKIWDPLSQKAKNNLCYWLSYINKKYIPECNWIFFRILVNCGLQKVGAKEFDKNLLNESFDLIEKFYIKDGWYNDGHIDDRRARDYYIPWLFHQCGLIFAKCSENLYPVQAHKYKERAISFAKEYAYWFDKDGMALPYGRSLSLRFALTSFWGALAFADVEALPWGQIKGLFLKNLRWWFKQQIFSETGLMLVGYTYPNLFVAERYSSSNSPLWALGAFIALAVPDSHPFWQSEEEPLKKDEEVHLQEATGFIISDTKEAEHLYILSAGQWAPGKSNEHNHMAEKYSKFAYSNYFGFNIATDLYGIDKLGHDNMLLVSEEDEYYRFRTASYDYKITKEYLSSKWNPFSWMEIETYIIPYEIWHLRVHHIISERSFITAEGGFALAYNDSFYPIADDVHNTIENRSSHKTELGFSGIINIFGSRTGRVIIMNPNCNIIHPHTLIPTLFSEHTKGEVWLGCAVLAHPDPEKGQRIWDDNCSEKFLIDKIPDIIQSKIIFN